MRDGFIDNPFMRGMLCIMILKQMRGVAQIPGSHLRRLIKKLEGEHEEKLAAGLPDSSTEVEARDYGIRMLKIIVKLHRHGLKEFAALYAEAYEKAEQWMAEAEADSKSDAEQLEKEGLAELRNLFKNK